MRKNCLEYPLEIVEDVFGEANDVLAATLRAVTGAERPRFLLVADDNVAQRTEGLGLRIGRYVQVRNLELVGRPVLVGGGERAKDDGFASVMRVVEAAMAAHLGKTDAVVALGGGSVLDVAGYAAAQVRGGLKVVRVPTTPAAMFDGAFADYAAVNAFGVKDALRVPSVPAAVVVDPAFAKTVLDGVWRGGFSEAVRLAVVRDAALMKKLVARAGEFRARDYAVFVELLNDALALRRKKPATAFGEWSAMRLEAMSGYKLPHGYAVAIGVIVDTVYAVLKGYAAEADRDLVIKALTDCGAMDGAVHSKHLLQQTDSILAGLDAWTLTTGSTAIELTKGIGKAVVDEKPDRDTMKTALNLIK